MKCLVQVLIFATLAVYTNNAMAQKKRVPFENFSRKESWRVTTTHHGGYGPNSKDELVINPGAAILPDNMRNVSSTFLEVTSKQSLGRNVEMKFFASLTDPLSEVAIGFQNKEGKCARLVIGCVGCPNQKTRRAAIVGWAVHGYETVSTESARFALFKPVELKVTDEADGMVTCKIAGQIVLKVKGHLAKDSHLTLSGLSKRNECALNILSLTHEK